MNLAPDNHFGAEVKVTLTNGESRSARLPIQRGRTNADPGPEALLRSKFENCASRVLAPATARRAADMIAALEDVRAMRELTQLLDPVELHAASAVA